MKMNKKGVTMIELVIVFVIIAIGAVLIAPNIGAWLPNYRLRSAARDVVSTMRTAQMKAVSTNTQYQVAFNAGARTYVLQRNSTGVGWVDDGAAVTLPAGVAISAITFPGSNAQFNPNSTSFSGSVTLTGAKGQRQIFVTAATGRIRIE